MSESLERTTDCPLPLSADDSNPDEEKDSLTGSSELCWEDGGLPMELQRGMETLRVNKELTDVVLCVQGHDFLCHRAILAAASQYFRAMFCSGLKESNEERVKINGLDSGTMQSLLEYTYTSRALLTHSNVQRILEAASQFQFLRVVDACSGFLSKSLQLESCIGILNLAENHALPALKTVAQDYIVTKFSQVVQQPDFLDLPAESLEAVLQRDDLDVKCEECVFEALMRWVRARQDEHYPSLARLLSHVRLPLLGLHLFRKVNQWVDLPLGWLFPFSPRRGPHLSPFLGVGK
ncbi:kelch-like protein 6 [Etheostoma spectabile]|uniref:kelch-like protein 6 n=1 Tax=Etheostoma spectabile TaxID=54343 RepID=UPI0013AF5614|nr:kelch-like protein 6 [Etheostoma spectabile]